MKLARCTPLPGPGLLARAGDLAVLCGSASGGEDLLLTVLNDVAASGGDGSDLVRQATRSALDQDSPSSWACAGVTSAGAVAVLVHGGATALVVTGGQSLAISAEAAVVPVSKLFTGPLDSVVLTLPGHGDSDPRLWLDRGVIHAGGVEIAVASGAGDQGAGPAALAGRPERVRATVAPWEKTSPPAGGEAYRPGALPPGAPSPIEPLQASSPRQPPAGPPVRLESVPASPPQQEPPDGPPVRPERLVASPPEQPPAGPGPAAAAGGSAASAALAQLHLHQPDPDAKFDSVLLASPGGGQAAPAPPATEPEERGHQDVLVEGVYCPQPDGRHFNSPDVAYCRVCGLAMLQQTSQLQVGPQPPLGVLLLDDGMTVRLDADYVIGREPGMDPDVIAGRARPLRIVDREGMISRLHLRVSLNGWQVQVTDLGSSNGSVMYPHGGAQPQRLVPRQGVEILPGATIGLGGRALRYESYLGG